MTNYLIIAGKGNLPKIVKEHLGSAKVLGFASDAPDIAADLIVSFGEVGKVLDFARANNISKIIFAGGMSKPDFKQIKPDAEGAKLLAKIVAGKFLNFKGDNDLLTKIISFLENKGFEVVAAHEVVQDLVAKSGVIAGNAPNAQALADIEIGMKAAHNLGKMDIGQAVVVEDGVVLGTEGAGGTTELIVRAGALIKSYGGVLVKACKPQQDLRVDLPSIGAQTILQLTAAGISGVAVEAGKSLILEKKELLELARKSQVFVYGA